MRRQCSPLLRALRSPEALVEFSLAQWDRIIPQARAAGLLGRLGALARRNGLAQRLPRPVWHALEADMAFADRQAVAVRYELAKLDRALADLGVPVVILKGVAYVAGGLAVGEGRVMSDIDILVPKEAIHQAEAALMLAGWVSGHHDPYDQRYYRQWMHEIPPMLQARRGTVLDVHHNLLPETARIKTRPERVIAEARPLAGYACLALPTEIDLILHSATHLMHEGEWRHGLRDLSDLHMLITSAAARDAEFWAKLSDRAHQLGLGRPLDYALAQLGRLFDLAPPALPLDRSPALVRLMTNGLLAAGLSACHADCRLPLSAVAEFLLYVRSHWLRMPLHLLLPHLVYKAFRKEESPGGHAG